MKKSICYVAALFFLATPFFEAKAGYKQTPWGSKTWEGPGRPPHWSPKQSPSPAKPPYPERPIAPAYPVDPGWGIKKESYCRNSSKAGGYWRDRYNKWQYHQCWQPGYRYFKSPEPETIVIEREKTEPVYVPVVPKEPSRLQCGGRTITRSDPQTGELIIEYITSSRNCP